MSYTSPPSNPLIMSFNSPCVIKALSIHHFNPRIHSTLSTHTHPSLSPPPPSLSLCPPPLNPPPSLFVHPLSILPPLSLSFSLALCRLPTTCPSSSRKFPRTKHVTSKEGTSRKGRGGKGEKGEKERERRKGREG